MRNRVTIIFAIYILICMCAGCSNVSIRKTTRPRSDQNVNIGNCGYLSGQQPKSDSAQVRNTEREYIQTDIELPFKKKQKRISDTEESKQSVPEQIPEENFNKEQIPSQTDRNQKVDIFEPEPEESQIQVETPQTEMQNETDQENIKQDFSVSSQPETMQEQTQTYKVKKGDTLWKIAADKSVYGDPLKWREIYEANKDKIKDPNMLEQGIELEIPKVKTEEIKETDTSSCAVK